jgi:glycosyltransferase involved in cell wall biosynthesis
VGPTDESPEYYRDCVELTRHLGLEGRLTFTGRADVRPYYERFDLLMLTSVKEAQPLTLIEAMTAGVPIVATDVGDVRDLLQGDGLVVPPKDPDELAKAAIQLLSNPARARAMAKRARERALRQYDIRKIWRDYAALYHHLMHA